MPPQRATFAAIVARAIAQNVLLCCASAGPGTVARGWINHRLLPDALKLNEDKLPVLTQTVGRLATAFTSGHIGRVAEHIDGQHNRTCERAGRAHVI